MAGKGESIEKHLDAKVAKEVVQRHELKVSPVFLAKQKTLHESAINRSSQEHKLKMKEGSDLLSLRVQMATENFNKKGEQKGEDEKGFLNDEEHAAYLETIDQFVNEQGSSSDDKEALRVTMAEVIFKPKVFALHYEQWKSDYESNPKLQQKFPKLQDYVLDRGKLFIKARRNEIIVARVGKFQKDSMPKTSSETEQKAQLEAMQGKILDFVQQHEEDLLSYSSLDLKSPKRTQLFQKFVLQCGLEHAQIPAVREFFDDFISTLEVSFTAEKKLEARNEKMILLVQKALDSGKEIDEKEWGNALDEELKKDVLFEKPHEQQPIVPAFQNSNISGPDKNPPLDSPEAVGKLAGGLRITDYDPKTHECMVHYPDSELITTMKIIPALDSQNFDDATFVFDNKYADKDKGNKVSFDKKSLRSGCNQMFLDYLMNDWILKNKTTTNFSPNDILKDHMMVSMAERLLGKDLNEVTLDESKREVFIRFFEVLLKGDEKFLSFEDRVKKMDTVLRNPIHAKTLYKKFEKDGTLSFTFSNLLQDIGYKE